MNLNTIIPTISSSGAGRIWGAWILAASGVLLVTGCESRETIDVAKAQECLNRATPATAESCIEMLSGYNSAKANAVKCGAGLLRGGLTTARFARAYSNLSNSPASSPQAAMMALLALNVNNDGTASKDLSSRTQAFCSQSGQKSLAFLGNLAVMGTSLAFAIPSFNLENPDLGALDTLVDACRGGAGSPGCTLDLSDQTAIGGAVIALGSSYCATAPSDDDVCKKMNNTIQDAGSDPAVVGQALFCYLNNQVWNGSGCQNP